MSHDPYRYFRVEARELLERLGQGVLELERGFSGPHGVAELLRQAHTLKGAARVVRQGEIAELAHSLEDALAPLREGEGGGALPRERIDQFLRILDDIGGRLRLLTSPPPEPGRQAVLGSQPDEPLRTERADILEMDALLGNVAEASFQVTSMKQNLRLAERARQVADLLMDQLALRPNGGPVSAIPLKTGSLGEELVTILARLERGLSGGLEQMEREMRQVRDAAEQLRLLPASVLFGALERTARDVAQLVGKGVGFEARGGEVRLDAQVLGEVQGALVQLVRNAVAHGIESVREREAAGKPAVGRVVLEVVRRGSRVAFRCRDDGRGVDLDAVRRVARSKGLLPEQAKALGPEQILQLLLKGGLTTSGEVTEVSGRGIGLDVVREAAAKLGGSVSVATEPGSGTRIELDVPVSLSSFEALVAEVSGITVAIPLEAVRGTLRVAARDIVGTPGRSSILHEGKVIPIVDLSRQLGRAEFLSGNRRFCSVVVVEGGAAVSAVGADRLLGTENVVLRPLPPLAPADPIVAGFWLDGEGYPQIVLDPERLVLSACGEESAAPLFEAAPRPPLLVVDDSLTTRMLEQSILESAGYEVDLAVSGEEALEKARKRHYGLFLVDIEMPGMDGFTFIDRARADPRLCEVPAILVTSRSAPEDRRRGEELGARAYLVKSEFDQAQLLETIRKLAG